MRAGAVTPATPGSRLKMEDLGHSLNEGRGCNPGDTAVSDGEQHPAAPRSMRAGAVTPATRVRCGVEAVPPVDAQ